ncbi:MAG: hypothetical protein Q7R97_01960 [Candidatus Daviesbacteria bacterium]|nr:hypothetical protein [Candidatus Daviesbacteria bacterium]
MDEAKFKKILVENLKPIIDRLDKSETGLQGIIARLDDSDTGLQRINDRLDANTASLMTIEQEIGVYELLRSKTDGVSCGEFFCEPFISPRRVFWFKNKEMSQVNGDNIKKLDRRLDTAEEELAINPPPELVLVA